MPALGDGVNETFHSPTENPQSFSIDANTVILTTSGSIGLDVSFLPSTIQLVVLSRVQLIVEDLGEPKVEPTNPSIDSTIFPAGVANDDHSPQATGTGLMDDVRRSGM